MTDTGVRSAGAVEYRISPKSVLRWLMIVLLTMHLIGSVGRGIEILLGIAWRTQLVRLFYAGGGGSLTNWFSYMLLVCSAILLAMIARGTRMQGRPYVWHWASLGLVFLLMSFGGVSRARQFTVALSHGMAAWLNIPQTSLILTIPFVIGFVVVYARFFRDLPRDSRLLFAVAGGLFVVAAIVLDAATGLGTTGEADPTLLGFLPIAMEELLEDAAVVLFIYAILTYIRNHLRITTIQLGID